MPRYRINRLLFTSKTLGRSRIEQNAIRLFEPLQHVLHAHSGIVESPAVKLPRGRMGTSRLVNRVSLTHLGQPPSSNATEGWPNQRASHQRRDAN